MGTETLLISETCMFGDQLGLVEGVATCSAIVTSDLSRCYYSATKGVCCSSCESRKTNIPGIIRVTLTLSGLIREFS